MGGSSSKAKERILTEQQLERVLNGLPPTLSENEIARKRFDENQTDNQ